MRKTRQVIAHVAGFSTSSMRSEITDEELYDPCRAYRLYLDSQLSWLHALLL
jgi:hypothetical protein